MGKNVFDTLKERGFIKQTVYEEDLYKLLGNEKVTFYVGFDPTADSLHLGHYIPVMAMAHMQRAGHKPIALLGGGTGMIGDPSGRTDMRKMMTKETVEHNVECFKKQMSGFVKLDGDNPVRFVNNADWLTKLNYIDFLRDIGVHFSVNQMLTCECFKTRMEKGLSFLEFNYMLMQAYDFYVLHGKYGCKLQIGGSDQWSNMLAGADLIRRKAGEDAFAMTFTLLLTSEGKKMGKTAGGALWLDGNKTSPYDFYQYFRNVEDCKVGECMKLLTFMDLDEIEDLTAKGGESLNAAKERLAYEVTKLVHGEEKAEECQSQARAAFSGDASNMPSEEIDASMTFVPEIMVAVKAAPSRGEARRIIQGGGVLIDGEKLTLDNLELKDEVIKKGEFVLQKGKKFRIKVVIKPSV